jgi:hypothetical protein
VLVLPIHPAVTRIWVGETKLHTFVTVCYVYFSEETMIIFLHSINWVVLVTKQQYTLCDGGTQFLSITLIISDFRGLNKSLSFTFVAQH